jgi:hypothetical protein
MQDLDYAFVFALIARFTTLRALLAPAYHRGLEIE